MKGECVFQSQDIKGLVASTWLSWITDSGPPAAVMRAHSSTLIHEVSNGVLLPTARVKFPGM